jgi:hypothetical protein
MPALNYPETTKWVVAHNNIDIFHVSEVQPQNCFTTGQPYMDVFDTKEDLLTAFPDLTSQFQEYILTDQDIIVPPLNPIE